MYFVGLLMLRYFEVTFNYPKECIIMIRSISQTVMQMDFSNTFCMFDPISMYQYIWYGFRAIYEIVFSNIFCMFTFTASVLHLMNSMLLEYQYWHLPKKKKKNEV